MKRISILFLTAFIINCSFSYGQEQEKNEDAVKPTIEFDKTVHQYGTIQYNADGNCTFTFENKGEVPLVLNNVRASCGCTSPKWTREPVAPGQKGEIKVKYNTRIVGNFTKAVVVYSNAENSPVRLTIKGKVVKD